ncbi:MAG TPA: DUF642 domain-containing protein [Candidatus Nitrosotenuis sp.]|nr:DUF642 domain-containing protein [Candidatus Nitrosotenuis sp.]
MTKTTLLTLFLSIIIAGAVVPFAYANPNLVTNGSFEDPDIPSVSFTVLPSIPGWTTTFGPGIEIQDNPALAFDGTQYVELDSHPSPGNSAMAQTLITTPGTIYELSFAYSPRPGVSAESNGIEVYWDGSLIDTLAQDGTGLISTAWDVKTHTVVASSSSAVLEFKATGTPETLGGFIDGVSVVVATLQSEIDIKPGSDPNSINCKSKGVVPIGIISGGQFDATTIDISTLTLNGNPTAEAHGRLHIEDINGDAVADAVVHVSTADMCAATTSVGTESVTVAGSNANGMFEGTDDVRIVKR